LALLSWRHGMRPGTDPKVLGGSVFLFIFAAICFSGWIESLPPNSKQAIPNPGQPTIASAVPLTSPDTVPCKTVNITACVGTPAPKQSLKSAPTTKGPQPSNAHHPAKNAPVVTTTNDPATGRTIFSNGTSAVSSEPLPSPKPTATLVNKTWRNLRDGQTYRTRLDGETLYLESTESYPKRTSDIANCKFHRAISVGLSWVGECWERNPKDQSIYKSDATVTTFSEARIEIGTGDKTPFAMIPAENAPSSFSQNSVAVGTQVVSPAPSSAPLSPERALAPSRAMASPQSDVSSLSVPERQSIEAACATAKYNQGPAAYNQCLQAQLSELRAGPRRPDLSDLSVPERQSIEAACATAKYNQGPAAYNQCLQAQLSELRAGPRRPDLSDLSVPERQSIEAACATAKYNQGPATYNQCLQAQLSELRTGPRRPDLSDLSVPERQSIEAVCATAKYNQGPAAYNRCLRTQLELLKKSR
jgi:hypothetical protein